MTLTLGRTRVHITFLFAAGAAFMSAVGGGRLFGRVFLAACLHEGAHLLALNRCGCPPASLTVGFFGMRLPADSTSSLSYRQEALCVFCAPFANLLCGGLLLGLYARFDVPALLSTAAIHLSLGFLNLLPLRALDGGRVLSCLLLLRRSPEQADRILALVELLVFPLLLVFVFFCLLRNPRNYSALIFAIYLVLLLFFRK